MDNQASELELQRILKASEQDTEVKATWARYQLASSLLRGEQAPVVMPDFAARLSAAIDKEDALVAQTSSQEAKSKQGWLYQFGRMALVASVAGGMVVGVNQFNATSQNASQIASNVPASTPVDTAVSLPSGINSPAINTRTVAVQTGYETRPQENRRVTFQPRQPNAVVSDEEVSRYVNQMIKAHSDNAAMNSGQGVLPYARVIITDEE
ncbi:MAG: mucA [Moraxellaceae bacterium]|nr:MAG: mucA [Moraxellaceae bacterium]